MSLPDCALTRLYRTLAWTIAFETAASVLNMADSRFALIFTTTWIANHMDQGRHNAPASCAAAAYVALEKAAALLAQEGEMSVALRRDYDWIAYKRETLPRIYTAGINPVPAPVVSGHGLTTVP